MAKDKWKYRVDNKMRVGYGETDYDKKTIRINKKMHKKAKKETYEERGFSLKDASLINTIVHERMHKNHPKMHEKTVRKESGKQVSKMSAALKQKLYKLFS